MNPAIIDIINYLNVQTASAFVADTQTQVLVQRWLDKGYTAGDFKRVIDVKIEQWKGTTFEDYLRPKTLFSDKFKQYTTEKKKVNRVNKLINAVEEAKDFNDWDLTKKNRKRTR